MLKTASVTCFLLVGFRFTHVNIVAKKRESPYIQYLAGKVDFEHLPRAHKSVLYIFRTFTYIHIHTYTLLMLPKWAFQLNRIKNTNLYKLIKNVSTIIL